METSIQVPQGLKLELPYDPEIPLLRAAQKIEISVSKTNHSVCTNTRVTEPTYMSTNG
jgi:hypothetical protein